MIIRGIDLRDLHRQHFACFACRKAFKPRAADEPGGAEARPVSCPECGQPMAAMGRDFQAPPRRDRAGWLVAELLLSFGVAFEPSICGPGHRPRRLREAVAFLAGQGHDAEVVADRARQLRARRSG